MRKESEVSGILKPLPKEFRHIPDECRFMSSEHILRIAHKEKMKEEVGKEAEKEKES